MKTFVGISGPSLIFADVIRLTGIISSELCRLLLSNGLCFTLWDIGGSQLKLNEYSSP